MVLTLEGDNVSRLVWDIQDYTRKERDTVYLHNSHDKVFLYQTSVHTTEHRMVVKPDVHTGEYVVWLPPVKWKIQQITAKGYPTLFQDGMINDVVDLTDSLTLHRDQLTGHWTNAAGSRVTQVVEEYHAKYSRIYHTPVILDYKQVSYDKFDYFGDKAYNAKNMAGESVQVPLCYPVRKEGWPADKKDSLETVYTFGHPVFNIVRSYPVKISATERYYYNNNTKSDTTDVIRLAGGVVTIQNGMIDATHRDTVHLDDKGERMYVLTARQTPYMLTGDDALRTVTMTLLMDGTYYEAKPLKAYVLNQYVLPGAKDLLSVDKPLLIDILRDPPGGNSSATLSKGSTLKYAHEYNWSVKGGLTLTAEFGHALTNLQAFGFGTILGIINEANNVFTLNVDLIFTGTGKEAWSYTMTNNVDISTSSSEFMVGADADVYIGAETSYTLKPMVAVRAIPESMWKQLQGQLHAGRMVEIACGHSASGDTLHLVRDEMIGIGPKVKSTFMHSQSYIVNQLIPELCEQCQSLMFTGTKAEAEAVADATGKNVYWSLREPGDPDFGVVNTAKVVEMGDESWEYVFNLTEEKPKEGINYLVVRPKGSNSSEDKVAEFSQSMFYWAAMIAQNEHEKLTATELVRTFDVDGGMSSSYGEGFSSDYSTGGQMKFPWDGGLGQLGASLVGSLANLINRGSHTQLREDRPHFGVEMPGYKFGMAFGPVIEYNIDTPYSEGKSYSRKESFSIGMDRQSHLIFDVYRVKSSVDDVAATDGKYDVFVNKNFNNLVSDVDDEVTHKMSLPVVGTASTSDLRYARGFVYRTRGGATQRPFEGERRTQFYSGGHVLDEATKKIEVPVLKVDRQSISGVPFGEPARLKLYMTNESEQPEAAYPYFDLMLVETSNPKGAKLMIDGMPLSGNARVMEVRPGQVTEKTLEVFAGEDFDYENLRLMLRSQGDPATFQEAQFSVHFLQGAGPVEISMPGDKWIMNTDAAYDKQRGWHMPVIISGFDKNQKNFDHIELQYKETARGDDYWTNLCAFYADSAYYRPASGTKAMIPENGNIITDFFGEGMVMEKAYDLRAVLYCRNGNGYLTSASKVLSGVKDTRRPQLFGSPDPKDGILGAGDNVVFNFSEPIEHNYLRETTNFEVKGETNETTIHEEPALLFSGSGYAQSEARRNFADKDMTVEVMVRPDTAGIDMPIFSHGTDGKQLQLWITGENRLKAIVDERELTLATPLKFDSYVQVALVLDSEKKRLTLYADTLTSSLANVTYSGYGPLVFGSTNQTDVSKRQYFKGRMLQGRVWNRVLDKTLLNFYGNKLLTGYEMGLIDYYPMNEGRGAYANDEAQGAHLTLNGASWALPRGMSLRLDWDERRSVKGMHLNERFFSRTSEEDYSLMFWFKTDVKGRGALLSNGSGRKSDMAAEDKFFIGFEADTLKYRSNGMEYSLGTTFSDDAWHHYAMTVNRAHQVASIYVDNVLKAQFATENLGGMTGSDFYLGNMVWHEQGPANDVLHQYNALTGYIDGICLFEQALPTSLIRRYSSKALGGSEKGLKVYLDFNRQERQKNGDLVLRPYTASQKIYYDPDGRETARRDTVFIEADETVRSHIDQSVGAPIQAYEELRNLNFSFVGRDHQLLVNLDEIDARINKRTVYVTVFDIPDLNGNSMASPATMSVFVDRNPLRWAQKTLREVLWYDGYDYQFTVDIMNNSGAAHTFKVENMPKWLSVDRLSDMIEPKSEQWLRFTINKDTNVGTYDHIIYLTDENGLSEPLMLNITVEGTPPGWEVAADMKQYSMSVVGRVQIGDDIVTDSRDIVGVFDNTGRCMGCSNVNYDPLSAEALAYLTVYSDEARDKSELIFKLWHYATGKTMVLEESQQVEFTPNGTAGTAKEPIVLKTNNLYIQELKLEKGWNWVSFNVYNNHFREGVNDLLGQFDWQEGDILVDETNSLMLVFKNSEWVCNLTPDVEKTLNLMAATNKLSVGNSYRIKVAEPVTVELTGTPLSQPSQRVITVVNGWNYIGYTPMVNLRVTSALADYYDQATDGDVVKSKTEFAMFTKGANGKGEWKGNLKYMKPGEGYMLKRQRENRTSFSYPFMEVNASIPFLEGNDGRQESASDSRETGGVTRGFANNMTLAAMTDGVSLQEGDRLIALAEAEVRGEALVGDSVVYMTISGDQQTPLSFAIERDGEIVALTGNVMTFRPDAVSGSPDKPTLISFEPVSLLPQEGWFTLQGTRLKGRPAKRGVYIYNGHKQMIR